MFVCEQIAIGQHIRDFIAETGVINITILLEQFEKLCSLDGDTLRKIFG